MPARRSNTCLAGMLADVALLLGQLGEGGLVGDRAPQAGGDVVLLDLLQARGHAGLAEIFLREDVGGDLAPASGTSISSSVKTTEPSGFRISLVVRRNSMSA